MNIRLELMTKELARCYFKSFVLDPALFADESKYQPYQYSDEKSDATVDRYRQMGRIYFVIMLDGEPIGEIVLKQIDHEKKSCAMGITMRSDEFKNKGYGTKAELHALEYIFGTLEFDTAYADTLLKNTRSQHVLMKVGFRETSRDDSFVYYRCDKSAWQTTNELTQA